MDRSKSSLILFCCCCFHDKVCLGSAANHKTDKSGDKGNTQNTANSFCYFYMESVWRHHRRDEILHLNTLFRDDQCNRTIFCCFMFLLRGRRTCCRCFHPSDNFYLLRPAKHKMSLSGEQPKMSYSDITLPSFCHCGPVQKY